MEELYQNIVARPRRQVAVFHAGIERTMELWANRGVVGMMNYVFYCSRCKMFDTRGYALVRVCYCSDPDESRTSFFHHFLAILRHIREIKETKQRERALSN